MRTVRCPHCRTPVWTGETGGGKRLALPVTLDPAALDPATELSAVLAGRRTYTRHTGTGEVHARSAAVIAARPAGGRPRETVHAAHTCPEPLEDPVPYPLASQ